MFPNGLASQEGTIQKGNEVLSINGKSLKGATHNDALAILRQARDPRQAVIVTRKATVEATHDLNSSTDSAASASVASGISVESVEATVCTVTLEKTSAGLGFSLEGGKGSLHGDKPLTINRIFKGRLLCLPPPPYILSSCEDAANTPKPRTPENLFDYGGFPYSFESRVAYYVFSSAFVTLCLFTSLP